MARMAGSGSSGGPPAPRAGAGPTVIAAALVVLVIGLGWLNHGGSAVDQNSTPFARDVSQAVQQAQEDGLIPASRPAEPADIGSSGGDGSGQTSSTTIVVDPETGLEITINVEPGTTGTPGTTGGGSTGTTGGSDDPTTTSRPGSSTTRPTTTTTRPTTTTTETPTTTEPTTTTTETPPTTGGILEDLVGGLTGALGSVIGAVF